MSGIRPVSYIWSRAGKGRRREKRDEGLALRVGGDQWEEGIGGRSTNLDGKDELHESGL